MSSGGPDQEKNQESARSSHWIPGQSEFCFNVMRFCILWLLQQYRYVYMTQHSRLLHLFAGTNVILESRITNDESIRKMMCKCDNTSHTHNHKHKNTDLLLFQTSLCSVFIESTANSNDVCTLYYR